MNKPRRHCELKGKKAENLVHELAQDTFLADWCYLNPQLPNGKELSDLLVVFDQVAIIVQVKDLKLDAGGHYNDTEVEKNLRQLLGARRQLFDLKTPIELKNQRGAKEVLKPSSVSEVYLLSVLLGEGESYFKMMEFTKGFTQNALSELDTIGDFTAYLRAKEFAVKQNRQIQILGGEEELLAFYPMNNRSFESFEDATTVVIDQGSWQHLLYDQQYIAKENENEKS